MSRHSWCIDRKTCDRSHHDCTSKAPDCHTATSRIYHGLMRNMCFILSSGPSAKCDLETSTHRDIAQHRIPSDKPIQKRFRVHPPLTHPRDKIDCLTGRNGNMSEKRTDISSEKKTFEDPRTSGFDSTDCNRKQLCMNIFFCIIISPSFPSSESVTETL
jgi:hypothetical protein